MGCCISVKQFEHTENNDRQLKQEFPKKRRRSEAHSRNKYEDPDDKPNPVHQTYNFYYNGSPVESYTVPGDGQIPRVPVDGQNPSVLVDAQNPNAPSLPMTVPLFKYRLLLDALEATMRELRILQNRTVTETIRIEK
ncbi:uncharacterized protein LOC134261275 [Saccostrea cucullata]|uniref:uncharacterized protein LOC134261275 n=1 Tax=Saccostrea cuccullata TaxID=36930 RepID=UPI002ED5955B